MQGCHSHPGTCTATGQGASIVPAHAGARSIAHLEAVRLGLEHLADERIDERAQLGDRGGAVGPLQLGVPTGG